MMRIYHDVDHELWLADQMRQHPWTVSERNPENRYVDFRKSPDLIESSLEDFKPYSERASIKQFYEMLRWLHSDDAVFETNDCGLRGPSPNPQRQFDRALVVHGRLTLFFRNGLWNTDPKNIDWLCESLDEQIALQEVDLHLGCVSYARWPHEFTELAETGYPSEGNVIALRFWAWGDIDDETFENLDRVFGGLRAALVSMSDFVKAQQIAASQDAP